MKNYYSIQEGEFIHNLMEDVRDIISLYDKIIFNREQGTRMKYDIDYSDIKVIQLYYIHYNWVSLGPFPPLFNSEVEHLQLSYYNTEGAPEKGMVYFHKYN